MDDFIIGDYDFNPVSEKKKKEKKGFKAKLPGMKKAEKRLLLLQYQTWQRLVDNKLIFAPVTLDGDQRILEVATGAGFWMLDVASQLPKSVGLHGIDRSSRYFPKQPPDNISFSVCSATALPFSWTGYFDYAHQRFLSLAITLSEWKAAVAELYRVTKAGGWVQIGEVYPAFPSGKHGTKQKAIFYAISKARGLDLDIPLQLARHLSEAGFVDVKVEESYGHCGAAHGSQGQTYKGRMLALTKGMRSEVLKAGGFGVVESKQDYDEMLKGLEREYDKLESAICLYTCVARKPLPDGAGQSSS